MVSHIVRRWRRGNEERIDVGTVVLVSSDSVDRYMVVRWWCYCKGFSDRC